MQLVLFPAPLTLISDMNDQVDRKFIKNQKFALKGSMAAIASKMETSA